ncbi:hypothetical protein Pan189_00280 [Stratiformator vulcanicus]|uniref:Uncharacterized protein n=1 Tax=Stratiformator vulcanicus TaxID=2527980 RepID=A0A517QVK1_9PLAN|nr:hypothetical protein Pan189_00280 [Stratiformator vulcanicus]
MVTNYWRFWGGESAVPGHQTIARRASEAVKILFNGDTVVEQLRVREFTLLGRQERRPPNDSPTRERGRQNTLLR